MKHDICLYKWNDYFMLSINCSVVYLCCFHLWHHVDCLPSPHATGTASTAHTFVGWSTFCNSWLGFWINYIPSFAHTKAYADRGERHRTRTFSGAVCFVHRFHGSVVGCNHCRPYLCSVWRTIKFLRFIICPWCILPQNSQEENQN